MVLLFGREGLKTSIQPPVLGLDCVSLPRVRCCGCSQKGSGAIPVSTQRRSSPLVAACTSHSHQEEWESWAGKPGADRAAAAEGSQMCESHLDLWQLD